MASPNRDIKQIGIIGGGASGVLTAICSWKMLGTRAKILIFEPDALLGLGKAYSTLRHECLLNVPANHMSVDEDQPSDFVDWLTVTCPDIKNSRYWPFVPRFFYGQYIRDQIQRVPAKNLVHIRSRVEGIFEDPGGYKLKLSNGDSQKVDYLIVATGYRDAQLPKVDRQLGTLKNRILDGGDLETKSSPKISGQVLVIGSGLTAVDLWRQLEKKSDVKTTFISRHGLLPHSHQPSSQPICLPPLAGLSPLQIWQAVRKINLDSQISWAMISDQIRIQAERIWMGWSQRQRAQFLRHLRAYWEVIRHRIPPQVGREIKEAIDNKGLEVLAGRISKIKQQGHQLAVYFQVRGQMTLLEFCFDWIIIATGFSIEQSLIQENPLPGVGICPFGFGYINQGAPRFWTVGPASKGVYWEITAIPDIRSQVLAVIKTIAAGLDDKNLKRIKKTQNL